MTLQQQIKATLSAFAGGRVSYGQNFQEPAAYPYITFLFIASANNISLSGPSDVQNDRIQVDVFSRDAGEARALGAATRDAMLANFTVGAIIQQDFPPDPETKSFRASSDYSVWSK